MRCPKNCANCKQNMHLRVKLLGEDEVGRRASDGNKSSNGCCVGDAERQAFADHVIPLSGILGVSSGSHPLHIWDLYGNLKRNQRTALTKFHTVTYTKVLRTFE